MDIVVDYPPNYDSILAKFPSIKGLPVVFAYGDKLYSPTGAMISADLKVHEVTHMQQQGSDPEGWWKRYLAEPEFRLNQEIEAYRNQFRFYCRAFKDGNQQMKTLIRLATDLSSPMYGSLISHQDAMTLIR